MRHPAASAFLAMAMATASFAAQAQGTVAFTSKDVNVRAGPARDYPVVAVLPPGFQILVQGCLSDYRWCDVLAGGSRGWVYAGNISYAYQGASVPLLNYGAVVGIGILGFALNDYWHDHYRSRPFYSERDRWITRPRVRPAPRPQPPGTAPFPHPGPQPQFQPRPPRTQPAQPLQPRPQAPQPRALPPPQIRPHPAPGAAPRAPDVARQPRARDGDGRPPRDGRPARVEGQGRGEGRQR